MATVVRIDLNAFRRPYRFCFHASVEGRTGSSPSAAKPETSQTVQQRFNFASLNFGWCDDFCKYCIGLVRTFLKRVFLRDGISLRKSRFSPFNSNAIILSHSFFCNFYCISLANNTLCHIVTKSSNLVKNFNLGLQILARWSFCNFVLARFYDDFFLSRLRL